MQHIKTIIFLFFILLSLNTNALIAPSAWNGILFLPNAITPNNDDKNDFFRVLNSDKLLATGEKFSFKIGIYDRWGKCVFKSTDLLFKWSTKNTGVYYYIIQIRGTSQQSKTFKGDISVL